MVSPYSRHFAVVMWSDLLLDELDTLNEMAVRWPNFSAYIFSDGGHEFLSAPNCWFGLLLIVNTIVPPLAMSA